MDDYPVEINAIELEYLNKLSTSEREEDLRELKEFLDLVDTWDTRDLGEDPLQFNFFEANEFNLSVNKILHKYLGFDKRIAKDFFFRRFKSITEQVVFNHEIGSQETIYRFKLYLWDEFSIDKLVPEMFKELEELIEVEKIKHVEINVKSIAGLISKDLFTYTPNVEFIRLDVYEPIEIPPGIFDNTSSVQEIKLCFVSKIPPELFRFTTQLTKVSLIGGCQIYSSIFKDTSLLEDIFLQEVHVNSKDILQDLNIKYINFNNCTFTSVPSFVKLGGNSTIKRIQITGCLFPMPKVVNIDQSIETDSFITELVNKGYFPNLTLLEIWNNKPSSKIYNNLHHLLSTSLEESINVIMNLENDIEFAPLTTFPNVKRLTIHLKNDLTTMDSVKSMLRIFPKLNHFAINGDSLNEGSIYRSNFDEAILKNLCPDLTSIHISLNKFSYI